MVSNENIEVVKDVYPFFRVHKNGRVERFYDVNTYVPPSHNDPNTGVSSKDITISPHVSARLYLPKDTAASQKLPVLIYYHGGGLCLGSAYDSYYHPFLNILVSESNAIAVSVDYRLAPETDVPTLYEDCWTALQWVASHANNEYSNGDPWITTHGDFSRVFLAGDSAGGNIVFNMTMRAGRESLIGNVKIFGSILSFPYFLTPSVDNIEHNFSYKIWISISQPSERGINSPMINPLAEKAPSLKGLGCSKLFMCIGGKDDMIPREIGLRFVQSVKKSGWKGELEFIELEGEGHCFHIVNLEAQKSKDLVKRFAAFITHA